MTKTLRCATLPRRRHAPRAVPLAIALLLATAGLVLSSPVVVAAQTLSVPTAGATVGATVPQGSYTIRAVGTYLYDAHDDDADAKCHTALAVDQGHSWADESLHANPLLEILINGQAVAWAASGGGECDTIGHRYTTPYACEASSCTLDFRIHDTDYSDNRGSLEVSILGTAECDNGVDDDEDGDADFPEDAGCSDASDESERGTFACDNGLDDDGDGRTDYPKDAGCSSPTAESEQGSGNRKPPFDGDGCREVALLARSLPCSQLDRML